MTPAEVVARRRTRRRALLAAGRAFAVALPAELGVRAVVVFGSVARGDFNDDSDTDILILADHLPVHPVARMASLGRLPGGIEPVAWTPDDWLVQRARRDPIAVEATEHGVWLLGDPEDLEGGHS